MNINQHNCSLNDATMAALFIHPDAATELHTTMARLALSQWMANEQLKNRRRKKEEREKKVRKTDCQASGWAVILPS